MATNFTKQARKQMNPAFDQQVNALKSRIPAINQLYGALNTQIDSQRQPGYQKINEAASGRGLLKSTIPVDMQTGLEQALLQQRAKLAGEQGKEIAGVTSDIAGIGVDRASSIADLANVLREQDLSRRQFSYDKRATNRQFKFNKQQSLRELKLQRKLADREYQLQKELAAMGIY